MANQHGYMGGNYPQQPPQQMPQQGGMPGGQPPPPQMHQGMYGGEMPRPPYPTNEQHPYPPPAHGQPQHGYGGGHAAYPQVASQPAYAYPPPTANANENSDGGSTMENMAGSFLSANPNAILGMMNANVKKTWLFRMLHAVKFSLYFEVDTQDVRQRLIAIFLPSSKYFKKSATGAGDFSNQNERGQHPDLYIPLMALVTHVILCSIARGLQGKFHPDFTADSFSRTFLIWLADVFVCKVILAAIRIKIAYLDLTALIGSLFVPLSVISAISLASRGKLFWITYAPLAFSLFLYLVRAIKKHAPKAGGQARLSIVLIAAFQLLMLIVLSPSSKWNPVRKYTVGNDQS